MTFARAHQRTLSALAFGLLALVAELAGRSLTRHLDLGRHLGASGHADERYYPFLLAGVKVGVALLLARLAWRFVRAHAAAQAGRGLLSRVGVQPKHRAPRPRLRLSLRLWLLAFSVTSLLYLVQTDVEAAAAGRWELVSPWLHTSALPVFAVLAVVVALVWAAVAGWLAEYEEYAQATCAHARRAAATRVLACPRPERRDTAAPRSLFGLAFESRPPPARA